MAKNLNIYGQMHDMKLIEKEELKQDIQQMKKDIKEGKKAALIALSEE